MTRGACAIVYNALTKPMHMPMSINLGDVKKYLGSKRTIGKQAKVAPQTVSV
jgi:hypothetical protein